MHQVSDAPIRVDRAVPEIHHGMAAARAKPQVTGPDEFSAPTQGEPIEVVTRDGGSE